MFKANTIISFSFAISLLLTACATTPAHKGCYVADPYVNGVYTGNCRFGRAHGLGKAVGTDSYEGHFIDGIFNGQGIYTWAGGDRYEGQFKDGKPHGQGTIFYTNGTRETGVWQNGEKVR